MCLCQQMNLAHTSGHAPTRRAMRLPANEPPATPTPAAVAAVPAAVARNPLALAAAAAAPAPPTSEIAAPMPAAMAGAARPPAQDMHMILMWRQECDYMRHTRPVHAQLGDNKFLSLLLHRQLRQASTWPQPVNLTPLDLPCACAASNSRRTSHREQRADADAGGADFGRADAALPGRHLRLGAQALWQHDLVRQQPLERGHLRPCLTCLLTQQMEDVISALAHRPSGSMTWYASSRSSVATCGHA